MTDLEVVNEVASRAWALALEAVFPGEAALLRDCPELTVEGSSFEVKFRLQQDRLGSDSDDERTMIRLVFKPTVPPSYPTWSAYIRGHWPERQDRCSRIGPLSARRLRKLASPRGSDGTATSTLFRHENIYVARQTLREDLVAQLCLFLIQTEISIDSDLWLYLQTYVRTTFRLGKQGRVDVANDVVLRLIRNKWWPEDARAWRRYVKTLVTKLKPQYGLRPDVLPDALADQPQAVRVATQFQHRVYDPSGLLLTVEEAARTLRMARSTLYARIQKGRVAAEVDAVGRTVIRRSELDQICGAPTLREVIRITASVRRCRDEAARKYVSRLRLKGYSLEEVMAHLRGQR